jgi:hypothetical protein
MGRNKEVDMAIVLKHSMNALAAVKKIGIPQHQYDWLVSSGVSVKLTSEKFVFVYPANDPLAQVCEVPVTTAQLHALSTNKMHPSDKLKLGKALSAAIWKANAAKASEIAVAPSKADPLFGYDLATGEIMLEGTLGKLPPLDNLSSTLQIAPKKAPEAQKSCLWEPFDLAKLKTAPAVKLRDATKLYQPVSGSSAGSRYYVVAGNNDIRVAARLKGKALSVRIEGPNFVNAKKAIAGVGFQVNEASAYASMHLNVEDDVLAAKTVGALLMGLGVQFDTALPNVQTIRGA